MHDIKWLNSIDIGIKTINSTPGSGTTYLYTLLYEAVKNNKTILRYAKYGSFKTNYKELYYEIRAFGARPVIDDFGKSETNDHMIFNSGFLTMEKFGEGCQIILNTTDDQDFNDLTNLIDIHIKDLVKEPKGKIFSLVTSGNDLKIIPIGMTKLPFERDNYSPKVINDLDHIISDMNSNNPCGKLTILDGEPGTGKTSLVRMLTDVINQPFILIQAHNLINWAGPAIINLLFNSKGDFDWPLIFVLEDADECLVPRKEGDMNAISVLLNLSDGILGSVFDVRIIATTNASINDLDPAILRYGRLCRRIKIDALEAKQANRVYKRISGKDDEPFMKEATLAEIYKYVKDPGEALTIKKKQERRIGFGC